MPRSATTQSSRTRNFARMRSMTGSSVLASVVLPGHRITDNAKYHHATLHRDWRQEHERSFPLDYLPPYRPDPEPQSRCRPLCVNPRAVRIKALFRLAQLIIHLPCVRISSESFSSVFFISTHSAGSGWAKQELQVALHRQISGEGGAIILPVILEDADVPPLLRQFHWIDLRGGNVKKGVSQLVEAIHHLSAKRSA